MSAKCNRLIGAHRGLAVAQGKRGDDATLLEPDSPGRQSRMASGFGEPEPFLHLELAVGWLAVWTVDGQHRSFVHGLALDQLQGGWRGAGFKEPLPGADDDRLDEESVLVDQA